MEFHSSRRRTIFLGTLKEIGTVELPLPPYSNETTFLNLHPYLTVGDAFTGLPKLAEYNLNTHPPAHPTC